MAKLKRLAAKADPIAQVECPVSKEELDSRVSDYPVLEPLKFAREHGGLLFQPVTLTINGQSHQLQFNHCTNPFCKWFGHSQVRFENAPNKPHRYKIVGSQKHGNQSIACNPDPLSTTYGVSLNCTSVPVSNWSVADEIARLATHDKVVDIEPEYCFHRESCKNSDLNSFKNPEAFHRRGKSTGNSKKWQCKECRKITNVLPNREESFSYNFNPKYAQYALTILRTYFNFCVAIKTDKRLETPAQRLGITDKQFSMRDIIYFK